MQLLLLAFLLCASHAVGDFCLQPDAMVRGKNPGHPRPSPEFPAWPYWLLAHGMVQGTGVSVVLLASGFGALWWLGAAEAIAHAVIDYARCEGRLSFSLDQGLHYACKALWLLAAATLPAHLAA